MAWRAQVEDDWKKSEQFKHLTASGTRMSAYRPVYVANWRMLSQAQYWPEELRYVLRQFHADVKKWDPSTHPNVKEFSPRFYVGKGDTLTRTIAGPENWSIVRKELDRLLGS